jgi:hypothetical protein
MQALSLSMNILLQSKFAGSDMNAGKKPLESA